MRGRKHRIRLTMKARTPAQRHYLRTTAAAVAAVAAQADTMPAATANAYELMLLQLAEHRRRLKQVQSIDRKIEAKRAFLPHYGPWVDGVLEADRGGQDDVLVTVMVWRIDIGDLAGALPLVAYTLRHGLTMPDQYKRGIACVAAEEFAEAALKQITLKQAPDTSALLQVAELTAEHDMPDEVRAKLHKAIGYALRDTNAPDALAHLLQALGLHEKVGVKKDIERLEREIKNATSPPDIAPANTGQG